MLKVEPLLNDGDDGDDDGKVRVMNVFKLENSQFEPLADVNKIQNALQVGFIALVPSKGLAVAEWA